MIPTQPRTTGIRIVAIDTRRTRQTCRICREDEATITLFFDGKGPGTQGTKMCDYCLDDLRNAIMSWQSGAEAPADPAVHGVTRPRSGMRSWRQSRA